MGSMLSPCVYITAAGRVTAGVFPVQLSEVEQDVQKGLSSSVGGPAGSLLDS